MEWWVFLVVTRSFDVEMKRIMIWDHEMIIRIQFCPDFQIMISGQNDRQMKLGRYLKFKQLNVILHYFGRMGRETRFHL